MAQRHRDDELRDPRRLLAVDDSRDADLRRELGREQLRRVAAGEDPACVVRGVGDATLRFANCGNFIAAA